MFITVKQTDGKRALINVECIEKVREDTQYYDKKGTVMYFTAKGSVIVSSESFDEIMKKVTKESRKIERIKRSRFELMNLRRD